ncbi:MAG TPA: 2-oxoacid:acceptor oxidoreductase family protein [Negativicutes bacterium]|nr:2-oxoacid:acceptor oxidoreductase family protein [Negativicutes bacterium]
MSVNNTYLRTAEFPSIWCPGCGHGIIAQAAIRAIQDLGWDKDEVYAVSGIGCSARTPAYMDFNSIQTTHGRALTFATGMKTFRPEKKVICFLGDGDCASIGGNHLIHAARRNIDLTVIVMNNNIYGMTGGQCSPTTPFNSRTSTTAYGNIDRELNICDIAVAAGATFVARSTAYHAAQLPVLIKQGIANKGFSLIEVIDPCPTGFGARNDFKAPTDMYDMLRDISVPVEKAKTVSKEELKGKIVIGVFKNEPEEEYIDKYDAMVKRIRESGKSFDLQGIEVEPAAESKPIERYECCLSGFGGQGLILAGIILSEAMIRQNKYAIHNQSYGPEARGGASRSDVIISDNNINYPEVTNPDLLLAMTQDSLNKFAKSVKKGGIILCDSTYVKQPVPVEGVHYFEFPITTCAKETMGEIRTANIIALGILTALADFVSKDAMEHTVINRLPAKVKELNKKAFNIGYEQGVKMIAQIAK